MNVIRNERMGTAYGDQIIRGVAECIRASLRTGEQVCRILGDWRNSRLLKSALVEDFHTILEKHNLSTDSIILELTESGYLETSQNVMNMNINCWSILCKMECRRK